MCLQVTFAMARRLATTLTLALKLASSNVMLSVADTLKAAPQELHGRQLDLNLPCGTCVPNFQVHGYHMKAIAHVIMPSCAMHHFKVI